MKSEKVRKKAEDDNDDDCVDDEELPAREHENLIVCPTFFWHFIQHSSTSAVNNRGNR